MTQNERLQERLRQQEGAQRSRPGSSLSVRTLSARRAMLGQLLSVTMLHLAIYDSM